MTVYDDMHDERFRRSPWWETPPEEAKDDELTTARRRREATAEREAALDRQRGAS